MKCSSICITLIVLRHCLLLQLLWHFHFNFCGKKEASKNMGCKVHWGSSSLMREMTFLTVIISSSIKRMSKIWANRILLWQPLDRHLVGENSFPSQFTVKNSQEEQNSYLQPVFQGFQTGSGNEMKTGFSHIIGKLKLQFWALIRHSTQLFQP